MCRGRPCCWRAGIALFMSRRSPAGLKFARSRLDRSCADKIVILDGLKAGESVATAGNFLIDSQMQLAGKPSLIDPTRAIAKEQGRKGPLAFEEVAVTPVGGDAGKKLEALYAAYFEVQKALAADKKPPPTAAQVAASSGHRIERTTRPSLKHRKARRRRSRPSRNICITWISPVLGRLQAHQSCRRDARDAGPQRRRRRVRSRISTARWFPAAAAIGCKPNGELLNPYFGSEMLRCGEKVHSVPAAEAKRPSKPRRQHDASPAKNEAA